MSDSDLFKKVSGEQTLKKERVHSSGILNYGFIDLSHLTIEPKIKKLSISNHGKNIKLSVSILE